MDYSLLIVSVCAYVESRVRSGVDERELEAAVGYSYPHVRKVFRRKMQVPISRYILLRKVSCAAFDMVHTDKPLTEIAFDYGFEQYDTFTRAFKRETGMLPSRFRKEREWAGRRLIASGVYAPVIQRDTSAAPSQTEALMNNEQAGGGQCILFSVPKVEYRHAECTPFPSCLKAVLNYMGQDIGYAFLMAASGAAFRLRWSKIFWDGGNVDITYIYNDPQEAFSRAFEAAGREYRFLRREDSDKQGFIDFIKAEIDEGRPVIALGIIGPPEACVIAGYQDYGNKLLGWNFFQDRPEYNSGTAFHDCGYFISENWWENKDTILLMSIGEEVHSLTADKVILENAVNIEERGPVTWPGHSNVVACGQEAYETWADWTADDKQFGEGITLPLLNERYMCQIDAQTMVGEGRAYAAIYMKAVAERHPETRDVCLSAAGFFEKASESAGKKMYDLYTGGKSHEESMRKYAKPETRKQISEMIREAAGYEARAMELVKEIIKVMV